MAACSPLSCLRVSITKSGCISASPPEKVTPPPLSSSGRRMRLTRAATSPLVTRLPHSSISPPGQARTHAPHAVQSSGEGQTLSHAPQWRQRSRATMRSVRIASPSGLWHQRQRSGQPFMNTTARMPGPSYMPNSSMSNISPVCVPLTPR